MGEHIQSWEGTEFTSVLLFENLWTEQPGVGPRVQTSKESNMTEVT